MAIVKYLLIELFDNIIAENSRDCAVVQFQRTIGNPYENSKR